MMVRNSSFRSVGGSVTAWVSSSAATAQGAMAMAMVGDLPCSHSPGGRRHSPHAAVGAREAIQAMDMTLFVPCAMPGN